MSEIEKEVTFLLASLPKDLSEWTEEFLADTYIPETSDNPQIRLRQRGRSYYITKKYPKDPDDLSTMVEETINLGQDEYEYLKKSVKGKYLAKTRYMKEMSGLTVEIDVYLDNLAPLLVLDIEWSDRAPDDAFVKQFDIVKEITQAASLAAGRIAGKTYDEIKEHIK